MTSIRRSLLPLPLIVLFTACSSDPGITTHQFRAYQENGVTIAETSGGPKYQEELFLYEEVVQLQQDDSNPESLLYRPQGMNIDDNGYYYVADMGNNRIAVFDNDGKYHHSIGRGGMGPGEFQGVSISVISDSLVYTHTGFEPRLQVFNTAGHFLYSMTHFQPPFRLREIHEGQNGERILLSSWIVEPDEQGWDIYSSAAMVFSAAGDTLSHIRSKPVKASKWMEVSGFREFSRATKYFSGRPRILYVSDNRLLMSNASESELEWYDLDGNITGIIRLNIEPEPVTSEDRDRIHTYLRARVDNAQDPRAEAMAKVSLEHAIIPSHKDFTISIHVDEAGFIWIGLVDFYGVGLWERRPEFIILSPSGEYLGSTRWPGYLGLVSHGHFLLHATDPESGEEIYTAYKIIPAVSGLDYPN